MIKFFAFLLVFSALQLVGHAHAQEIIAFEKRAGLEGRLIQQVVYRNEGWRNLRLVHFETYFDRVSGRPMAPKRAYYVCGRRMLLVPTSTWQIRNDEYTQYRGVREGETIFETGYNLEIGPAGFQFRFAITQDEYPSFIQEMTRVCADVPDHAEEPQDIVLAIAGDDDATVHYLRAGRFSRDRNTVISWTETQRLRRISITAVFNPGTAEETTSPLDVYVQNTSVGHELTQSESQCTSGTRRWLREIRYAANGTVLSTQDGARDARANPFSEVAPGTVGEASLELACMIE